MLSQFGALLHRFECLLQVEAIDAFHGCIRDNRNSVITDHGVCFVSGEFPNGQASTLFVLNQERVNEIACTLLIEERVEGMSRAKSVPQREDRVVGEVLGFVNLQIASA